MLHAWYRLSLLSILRIHRVHISADQTQQYHQKLWVGGGAVSSSAGHKPDQKNTAKKNKHNTVQVINIQIINIQQGRYGSILDAKKAQIRLLLFPRPLFPFNA